MNRLQPFSFLIAVAALLIAQRGVQACAVCFGDPDSNMTHGAFAGVLVLFGIIASVLAGVVGTGIYWAQRGRRLGRIEP